MILDLNGRINFNIAGNRANLASTAQYTHVSHHGIGPYEINPTPVLVSTAVLPDIQPNELQNLLLYRYGVNSSGVANNRPAYAPYASAVSNACFDQTLASFTGAQPTTAYAYADYSPVDFDAYYGTSTFTFNLGSLQNDAPYTSAGYDNNLMTGNHASLFNPYLFLDNTPTPAGLTLRLFDMRETAYRYSSRESSYAPPIFGNYNNDSSFIAFKANTNPAAPIYSASPNQPRNKTRAESTIISNSLARAGVMPNFTTAPTYTFWANPADATTAPTPTLAAAPTFSPTASPVDGIAGGYRSIAGALGAVDLNRPLADYRIDITTPLMSGSNAGNPANAGAMAVQAQLANRDRQIFAKDIFDRLVVATGTACDGYTSTGRPWYTYNPETGTAASNPVVSVNNAPVVNTIRYLAQLAANIVDFIDNDDVSTAFVWNPAQRLAVQPYPEQDQSNFDTTGPGTITNIGFHTVYGVEKPRLVLNEVYAEVTNDPADATSPSAVTPSPSSPNFQVRFFVEVMNPLNTDVNHYGPAASTTSPLGSDSAQLNIPDGTPTGRSVYQLLIHKTSSAHSDLFNDPVKSPPIVTGISPYLNPALSVTMPLGASDVEPNNGSSAMTAPNGSIGFRELAGNQVYAHGQNDPGIYFPNASPMSPNADLIQIPATSTQNRMYYTVSTQQQIQSTPPQLQANVIAPLNNADGTGKHAVQLVRLANPYLPANPSTPTGVPNPGLAVNPYIAVDAMWDIKVNDAILVGAAGVPPPTPGTRTAIRASGSRSPRVHRCR